MLPANTTITVQHTRGGVECSWLTCAAARRRYLVIIGDTFNLLTTALVGDDGAAASRWHFSPLALALLVGFTALCLAPLSALRSMDSLQLTSGIATVCIVFTVALVVVGVPPSPDAPPPAGPPAGTCCRRWPP